MNTTSRHQAPLESTAPTLALFGLLALSMLATRYHHFGNALHLADTSWAVFFVAGFALRPRWMLPALLGLAVAIDIAAVQIDGAAIGGCLTAAYPGLLVAYVALWATGRLAGRDRSRLTSISAGLINAAGWLTLGVLAAFALSNLSFWAWSGQFDAMPLTEYAGRVAGYLGGYLGNTALYALALLATMAAWRSLRQAGPSRSAGVR